MLSRSSARRLQSEAFGNELRERLLLIAYSARYRCSYGDEEDFAQDACAGAISWLNGQLENIPMPTTEQIDQLHLQAIYVGIAALENKFIDHLRKSQTVKKNFEKISATEDLKRNLNPEESLIAAESFSFSISLLGDLSKTTKEYSAVNTALILESGERVKPSELAKAADVSLDKAKGYLKKVRSYAKAFGIPDGEPNEA